MLPDADGIDVLRALKAIDSGLEVIVISGQGSITRALEAGQAGAFYFLEKSDIDPAGLLGLLDRAADLVEERRQHAWMQDRLREVNSFEHILGKSKAMVALFELVDAVAASDANVLIQGENGTGKELFANAIHRRSHRASGPFIKINCAALPKDLIESELFGYKKGAFTGAMADKVGLLELAHGGTLFLDEIGEMPACCRLLLRMLQERSSGRLAATGGCRWTPAHLRHQRRHRRALPRAGCARILLPHQHDHPARPAAARAGRGHPAARSYFLQKFNKRYHKAVRASRRPPTRC